VSSITLRQRVRGAIGRGRRSRNIAAYLTCLIYHRWGARTARNRAALSGTDPPNYHRAVPDTSLAKVLRSRGLRMTPQRQLVLDAVRQLGHATPEQVHSSVQRVADSVNITTVYRTLELLEELGLVTHTHLSHGAPTYHPAGERQHVHLVCRGCGVVEGIDPAPLEPLAEELASRHGFLIDIGHVAFFGRCATCGGEAG
jgi:Fur family transcriptional regulator, ferric uptake regulator